MKLVSLQIFPLGPNGWGSDLFEFGDNITQLLGPNGCGKTPIVQSIAYCLGYPCIFRADIYDKCKFAVLEIETDKGNLKLKRQYTSGKVFDLEVVYPDNSTNKFYGEQEFSNAFLDWLGFEKRNLIDSNRRGTPVYLSSILPIFYLDQDEGYNKYYCPPSNFVKDQFSEMMRLIFDLPIKNSFDAAKEKIQVKDRLDYLDQSVEGALKRFKVARQQVYEIPKTADELKVEIESYKKELENIKNQGATHDDSLNVFDKLISGHRRSIREIQREINETNKRNRSLYQIIEEINAEINTLTLNEEARRVFTSFNEICSSPQCQMFMSSSESYSKNLLYLRDQIKDLERNSEADRIKVKLYEEQVLQLEKTIAQIVDERNQVAQGTDVSAFVESISKLNTQVFALQNQLSTLEEVDELEKKYLQVYNERGKALEHYQSFGSNSSSTPALVKLRANLRAFFVDWLIVLETRNISFDVTFNDDFLPQMGVEKISSLKGSTRIRAVLAYHAALLQLMAENEKLNFGFLILDTPKQHEIHNDDLDMYFNSLKKLCAEYGIQVVFSTTEYKYDGDEHDQRWEPQFPGEKQDMFLRS